MSELPESVIVSVRELHLSFPTESGRQPVLRGISFDVETSETLVIMGGSGCGKSTLLNCLIGELEPDSGSILYNLPRLGQVDFLAAPRTVRDAVRRCFGIVFQSAALFSSLTVAENVALPLREHSDLKDDVIDVVVAILLQQVQMLEHRDKLPSQLSGGQRKRVGLARARALDPQLLYYDEPSAGLDPITSASIDALIRSLGEKLRVTSVVVTHDMDSAFRIADRMIMLDQGRVLRLGPRDEFDRIRRAPRESLADPADAVIQRFLNGELSDSPDVTRGRKEFDQILAGRGIRG